VLLLTKLILVPALIGAVTLAARRWGLVAGGLVMSLPVVAGPTLAFYAVEQGNAFAARAAAATLLGLVAVGAFCVVHARVAPKLNWLGTLLAAWLAFGMVTLMVTLLTYRLRVSLIAMFVAAVAALVLSRMLIPNPRFTPTVVAVPRWDLPARMLSAGALVLTVTALAERLGPTLAGALTPFPVATAIIAGFTHARSGPEAVAVFFRGFLPSLITFAVFCFILAATLGTMQAPATFALGLAAQLALQGILLWQMQRKPTM
jgi:hypothetical protein